MKRFQVVVFAASIAGVLPVAFVFSVMPAQAKQCSTERPPHARSYWSYRLIDGRKCWYEGKAMISKSLLHWPPQALAAQQAPAAQAKANEVSTPMRCRRRRPRGLIRAIFDLKLIGRDTIADQFIPDNALHQGRS